jgi:hypothetical protein
MLIRHIELDVRSNLMTAGRACRFCGAAKTITVSAWPEWATRLISIELAARYSLRTVDEVREQIFHALPPEGLREDFIATRKLRVACERCHRGWMSRLDAQVRPMLVPLVMGKPVQLVPGVQKALAAWIAKSVMIAELASLDDPVTPRADREMLRAIMEPPPGWNIWIAYNSARSWVARYVRHTAQLRGPSARRPDTQSITLGMGRILVHVMTSTVPGMKFELPSKTAAFHFLWPCRGAISWPPTTALDQREVEAFSGAFDRDFGAPLVEHIAARA